MKYTYKLTHSLLASIALCFLAMLPSNKAGAQDNGIELTPYVGYMWGGKERYANGEFRIDGGLTYGLMAGKEIRPGTVVEFSWNALNTKGRTVLWNDVGDDEDIDVNVNYFLIQGQQLWETGSDVVEPFGMLGVGAAWFSGTKNSGVGAGNTDDVWSFAMSLGLGLKAHLSDRIAIRAQGRLLMPLAFGGLGFGCGIGTGGGGCGGGVTAYSTLLQGDVGGGLVIRF